MTKIREAFEAWWFARNGSSISTYPKELAWEAQLAAIAAVKEGGPEISDVDTEWLYSVLRYADKNPDYFPDTHEGKRPLYPDEAQLFAVPLYKLPEDEAPSPEDDIEEARRKV